MTAPDVAAFRARIVERVDTLGPDDLAAVAWIVEQLPGEQLRASCEEVTARGWCSSSATRVVVPTTLTDHTRAALLSVLRDVSRLVLRRIYPAHRTREEVLSDEASRRTTALVKAGTP